MNIQSTPENSINNTPSNLSILQKEVDRRRTFAIISHPDAGKTTLTEKLLLYGGAIHLAGAVKAKAKTRNTTSDWMEIEKQRGISISTSVLQFEYRGAQINLLDTPGHKDFSEDTYRTLTAVDAAVMLIDAAKGVEPQTRKLFEVCRMRGIPIFTFINKLDRPCQDPMNLLDEIEKVLGIRSCPMTWPIGTGPDFKGVYDRERQEILFFQNEGNAHEESRIAPKKVLRLEDEFDDSFRNELELLELAGDQFDLQRVLAGELTPVFFGSAMNNFGVQRFLESFIKIAPKPTGRLADNNQIVAPTNPNFSAFFFKIQANMDPSHRDRVVFMRVVSGHFKRGMTVQHVQADREIKLAKPLNFFAQERVMIEEAYPGDIVGLLDTSGELRIGDTLVEGKERFRFLGVPRFSPENFSGVTILDPLKRKQLKKGLDQLAEEGVVQVYRQRGMGDKDPVLGAVGALQFEVLKFRLLAEYSVQVKMDKLPYVTARWVVKNCPEELRKPGLYPLLNEAETDALAKGLEIREGNRVLVDRDESPVVLFRSEWAMQWAIDHHKDYLFISTAPR